MRKVIIYDDRRSEKKDLFEYELKRQGIYDYEIFPAIVLRSNVIESISESFKSIIRQAKENNEDEIAIFEDDIYFPNVRGWQYFLEHKPRYYDVYIGGNYYIDNRIEYKAPLVKCHEWVGNHCILVNRTYYDRWLGTESKLHCDGAQAGLGVFYTCFPFPALQRPNSWSANCQAVVDYNNSKTVPPEYIYK